MRCKKHIADLSSGVGLCATCLRERLLELIAAQAQAQAQAQQAQLARFAIEDGLKHDPPPLIFPRSVSPYVSRRKSDDNSATWIHNQRFYSTPQVGPTYSTTSTSYFEATRSFKKKNRFSLFRICSGRDPRSSIPILGFIFIGTRATSLPHHRHPRHGSQQSFPFVGRSSNHRRHLAWINLSNSVPAIGDHVES